jgi:hypothetical protein
MANDQKPILERIRDMERAAHTVEVGFTQCYGREDAATLREVIAVLSRPLPCVGDGTSLNVPAREVVARKLCDRNTSDDDLDHAGTRKPYAPMPRCLYIEKNWRDWLDDADEILAAIDLAHRVSEAYERGVKDAAKVALSGGSCDRPKTIAAAIRALLPRQPATEDAPKHDDDDLQAACCIKYHQARELD